MTTKEPGDNIPITQENEPVVNRDPLKGYEWRDGEEIMLRNGGKLVLLKHGKNNFGFSYIDKNGTYHPDQSQEGGLVGPEDKGSPFILFGNTIMEAGEEISEENTEINPNEEDKTDEVVVPKKTKITSVVKKIADENGLTNEDLEKITGTGKGENITKKDIEEYIKKTEAIKSKEEGWTEVKKGEEVEILEKAKFSIKIGSSFELDGAKHVVTEIKERSLSDDESEYKISFDIKKGDLPTEKITMDADELEDLAREAFESFNGDIKKFKESLYGKPKFVIKESKKEKKKKEPKQEKEGEKEIKINGFVFVAGETTFQSNGELFRVDKIKETGESRLDWELTVSKIDPITREVIEQKQKDGNWLNEIIKDFASSSKINLKKYGGKEVAVSLANKEKMVLSEKLQELKERKTKTPTSSKKVVKSIKKDDPVTPITEDEETEQYKTQGTNELADFFSNNLNSTYFKIKSPENKKPNDSKPEEKIPKEEIVQKIVETKNEFVSEKKESIPNKINPNTQEKKEFITEEESSLKEIIAREQNKYRNNYKNSVLKNKQEEKGNKWRNIKAWALGLLGLGATAYGVKEYYEKDPSDKSLENESKYQYNIEKEPEGFYYENKKESPKQKIVQKEEEKSIFDNKKEEVKKEEREIQETTTVATFKSNKIEKDSSSSKQSEKLNNIVPEKAPSFLVEAISIYHPELTAEEKDIVGSAYSKVLEYISGDDEIESFYKNVSWLKTMSWNIDSTLDVSRKVLAGEYGEVGETEKRMAEYFIGFAKRQEEKGLPANGMNTEAYIISGLIKDAGIKKE